MMANPSFLYYMDKKLHHTVDNYVIYIKHRQKKEVRKGREFCEEQNWEGTTNKHTWSELFS